MVDENNFIIKGPAGDALLLFFVIMASTWVLLFSFRPGLVLDIPGDSASVNSGKCLVGALITSIVITLLLWLTSNKK